MPSFRLVNPLIIGEFQTTYNASDADDAAKMSWNSLGKYILGNLPQAGITLENMAGGKLHHYVIKEKIVDGSNKLVDYSINKLNVTMSGRQEESFKSLVNEKRTKLSGESQQGGEEKEKKHKKRHDDSSDSSSDSEDIYEKIKMLKRKYSAVQPIVYWWYAPYIYGANQLLKSVFTPVFDPKYIVMSPYVEIEIPSSAYFA